MLQDTDVAQPRPREELGGKRRMTFGLKSLFAATAVAALLVACVHYVGLVGLFYAAQIVLILILISAISKGRKRRSLILICILIPLGVFTVFVMPNIGSAPAAGRRAQCYNNIKQLASGVLGYAIRHGTLPPAMSINEAGEPLHSWRTLVLPELGVGFLYERLRLDEPWNSPTNLPVFQSISPGIFHCPDDRRSQDITSYIAVTGEDTVWNTNQGVKLSEITDRPQDTILLLELKVADLPWYKPGDVDRETLLAQVGKVNFMRLCSNHRTGFNAVFVDGHVEYLPPDVPLDVLEAMLTKSGGEKIEWGYR